MRSLLRLLVLASPWVSGCTATVTGDDGSPPPTGLNDGAGGSLPGGAGSSGDPSSCAKSAPATDGTRLPRLSHLQYDGAVNALLRLDLPLV